MIFSVNDHVEQIINGSKCMTRRDSDRYQEGNLYAVQRKRTAKGIPEGKIYISFKKMERKLDYSKIREGRPFFKKWIEMEAGYPIPDWQAKLEGGYTPEEFEKLYEEIHPGWQIRWAYMFQFFTKQELEEIGVAS